MTFVNRLSGLAVLTASALILAGAAMAADYNWTFQTSETAGEPGFVNKQKWAEEVGKLSGGRIEIEIQSQTFNIKDPIWYDLTPFIGYQFIRICAQRHHQG